AIRAKFFADGDPGFLVDVDAQVGDPHRRGRRVVIATFESGARRGYKAGPLVPGFAVLKSIDSNPCHSSDEARRYYWRVGGLLAALHALRGVDCHFENVIAHGDQPVPVDLETIVHPAISYREPERYDRRLAARILMRSILRVGLLPIPTGGADPAGGIDLSGVASVEGMMSPDRVLHWEKRGTDEMHA